MIAIESEWIRLTYGKIPRTESKPERLFNRYWQAIKRGGKVSRTSWVELDGVRCRMLNRIERNDLLRQESLFEGMFRCVIVRIVAGEDTAHLIQIVRKGSPEAPPAKRYHFSAASPNAAFDLVMRLV